MPLHRRRMLAPINSLKHFVARTNSTITAGTVSNIKIAEAVVAPAVATTTDVKIGSILKALIMEMWLLVAGTTTQSTQVTVIIEKVPNSGTPATFAQMLNLQAYANKHNIFYTFQGNLASFVDGQPSFPAFKSTLLIPKGKQRMARGDAWYMNVAPVAYNTHSCGMFIYKEYQ